MPDKPKILAFAGSTRAGSFNKKLARVAAARAEAAGAAVTQIDLRDLPMPLFDGDLEEREGIPENAKKLKALMKSHDGFLLACPEYNGSITGVLKNAIDWASRQVEGEKYLECFTHKAAALLSASPGALGGLRGLVAVRMCLGSIGVLVLPDQFSLPKASEAFAPDGTLIDARKAASLERVVVALVETLRKLHS